MDERDRQPARNLFSWQVRTFSLLWSGYAAYYLCRLNFAVAKPGMSAETGWSDVRIGTILSAYQVLYAAGQFINGQFAERWGARRMMTVALIVAAASNLGLAWASAQPEAIAFPGMLVCWAVNGYAQSAGWSLVVKTMSDWTPSKRRGTVIGLISTCYQVGNVLAWLLAGWLAQDYGWRATFWVPALFLIPMAATLGLFLRNHPTEAGFPPVRDDVAPPAPVPAAGAAVPVAGAAVTAAGAELSAREILRLTLTNKVLWVLATAFFCMNAVRYAFMNWAPDYMATFHGLPIKGSAFTAVALPLIGALGAISAGWVSDTIFNRRRAPVAAVMLILLAAACVAFVHVPPGQVAFATAMLGFAGFMIYGPDMLVSGAATADVHPRAAAAATGFTMCTGAAGAIFSGIGVGWLKEAASGQWDLVFWTLGGLSVVSTALMVSIWNARPR
ncbi:MAG: MFS transporter [Deltaproteobacteria bacterium]|nr:MFS transporter [Deltaproteobacteria bacterium]